MFIQSDQEVVQTKVEEVAAMAKEYKEIPDQYQNMQKMMTGGTLEGFGAPEKLLCVDDDCASRMRDMEGVCGACTCGAKDGKESPCKIQLNIEAVHSGLSLDAFVEMKNAAADFAGVDSYMVGFSLEEKGTFKVIVWAEDPSMAAKVSALFISDVQRGKDSVFSKSVAEALKETNEGGSELHLWKQLHQMPQRVLMSTRRAELYLKETQAYNHLH